jgi:ESF2/ABP1 family protein
VHNNAHPWIDEGKWKFRVKTGGNKRRNYTEGWMEFSDKKVAKYVATVFNNQKIGMKIIKRFFIKI